MFHRFRLLIGACLLILFAGCGSGSSTKAGGGAGAAGGSAGSAGTGGSPASGGTGGAPGGSGGAGGIVDGGGAGGTQQSLPAVIPLEITEPQPNLDVKNRFYKAYPGLEYKVRAAVLGGSYPFTYTLTKAPQGMTVDGRGVLTWPKPAASNTPYPVTLQVTDSAGATAKVSWTITVTTQGFGFVDAVNGHSVADGGTGTIDHPWKTMADWYEGTTYAAKYLSKYKGWFLYFRNGTYSTHDAFVESGPRLPLSSSDKPLVWLAYPGEHPVIDMSDAYIAIYSGEDDVWMSGLTFQNLCSNCTASGGVSMGIVIDSTGNRTVFYDNHFKNLPPSPGSRNQSCIKRGHAAIGQYMALLDNSFESIVSYGLISYTSDKVVVDGNTFTDFPGESGNPAGLPIGPKYVNTNWSIRDNVMAGNMNPAAGIWIDTYVDPTAGKTHDIEVDYNCVVVDSGMPFQSGLEPKDFGPIYVYRNTFVGGPVQVRNLTDTEGPVSFLDNVIVNADAGVTTNNSYSGPALILKDNLTGKPGDNIVDQNGHLTAAYAKYLGSRGCQVP